MVCSLDICPGIPGIGSVLTRTLLKNARQQLFRLRWCLYGTLLFHRAAITYQILFEARESLHLLYPISLCFTRLRAPS
jgi:hypothetical protein